MFLSSYEPVIGSSSAAIHVAVANKLAAANNLTQVGSTPCISKEGHRGGLVDNGFVELL